MIASKDEKDTDNREITAAIAGADAIPHGRKNRVGVNRRQGQVACHAERPPMRQQKAIARFQEHRAGNALHGEPALTGNHGLQFDAFVLRELD